MNNFITVENKELKEKYYFLKLENGFKITVIPKNSPSYHASVCCNFGGADTEYIKNGESFTLPSGTAHFLEHKMFENEDGSDSFLDFDNFGGNANAATSFESTCYYFSCTDNFYENLNVLLKSVSSVHFTDESVDKERKIIAREITMYEDIPISTVTRNLYKSLYFSHPTVLPVSGTIESIEEITKETLIRAYNDFYVPDNLSLCICGNVDLDRVRDTVSRYFPKKSAPRPETVFRDEPLTVVKEQNTVRSSVASALYCIGIKCKPATSDTLESYRKALAMRIAISLTFGRASDFYCSNYENGLLNERFYAGYTSSRRASHIVISGSGNEYGRIKELAIKELEYRKKVFFTPEQFLREKKAAYAESITLFDSDEDFTSSMAASAHLDYNEFDCIKVLRDITFDEIKEALDSVDLKNCAISVIKKG